MSKSTQSFMTTLFGTKLPHTLIVGALGFIVSISTNAAPVAVTNMAATATSGPVFLGEGGDYPFSEAVRVGNTLYMSGQLGLKDGKLVKGGIKTETKQALDNINTTLLKYGYQKSDIVKCMVMLTDLDDFDDFNKVYIAEMAKPYPVRSAFGVSELVSGASVEIECMAVK